jgi:hypothetical protein
MKMQFSLVGYEVPSQNVTMRRHHMAEHRDRIKLERWIRILSASAPKATSPRLLHILSIRKRLITDDANLRGGCKGLVDAIVAAGLLVDDKDSKAKIHYSQQTLAQAGVTKPTTVITVEDP